MLIYSTLSTLLIVPISCLCSMTGAQSDITWIDQLRKMTLHDDDIDNDIVGQHEGGIRQPKIASN